MVAGADGLRILYAVPSPSLSLAQVACAVPSTIHQFAPHTTIPEMQVALPAIAAMGYSAVQMPPIHPVSTTSFDGKLGSSYAPKDLMQVSPHMHAGVSPSDYLSGNYSPMDADSGWQALKIFSAKARDLGLRVVGDLVFAHTAADADVVARHERQFGPDFYRRDVKEGDPHSGATQEDGSWDTWSDIRPIDHSGPARDAIVGHFQGVIERFLESGVTVFRADAAPRIPNDIWSQLIDGARMFARTNGIETPVFYAEALGTKVKDEEKLIEDGGFDADTTSVRWWTNRDGRFDLSGLRDGWLIDRMEAVRKAGGAGVSFIDNHDVPRGVRTFPGMQSLMTQTALTVVMSASMTVLEGTRALDDRQPSVFLDRHQPVRKEPLPEQAADAQMIRGLLKFLFGLKDKYPILRSPAYTELIQDGGPIVRIQRTTPTEQIVIAINVGKTDGAYHVPAMFRMGNIFGTNTWPGMRPWFGGGSDTQVYDYRLAPGGMAVFHRQVKESEGLRLPGFINPPDPTLN